MSSNSNFPVSDSELQFSIFGFQNFGSKSGFSAFGRCLRPIFGNFAGSPSSPGFLKGRNRSFVPFFGPFMSVIRFIRPNFGFFGFLSLRIIACWSKVALTTSFGVGPPGKMPPY